MNGFRTLIVVALVALPGCSKQEPIIEREGSPPVTGFQADDAEMNAAMSKARATLPEFERRLVNPPASQAAITLKARFAEGEDVEHMWVDNVEVTADGYRGTLANEPVVLQSVSFGSVVQVSRSRVSDWMAIDDGKLVGGYTLRVIRSRVDPEKRASFDASFGVTIDD